MAWSWGGGCLCGNSHPVGGRVCEGNGGPLRAVLTLSLSRRWTMAFVKSGWLLRQSEYRTGPRAGPTWPGPRLCFCR